MALSRRARLLATCVLGACIVSNAHAADLLLKRVMLSTGGVGYVEYAASADGPATLGLDVPLEQVDDILKSVVVFDSQGGVGGIELPGRDSAHAAFSDVPFGPDALKSPADYLNALQGVAVSVIGPRPMTGRIVRAEHVREAAPPPARPDATVERTRVTLLADDGLKQFILEDAEAVQVDDPGLRDRITQALESVRRESGRDMRHITLHSVGTGQREIRVGYVATAPLWKVSYRLVLPMAGADRARLQGWAVLENQSGTDWNGVQLALQYGNPVTFRQAIYRSYYVQRPEVPVEVLGRLLPNVDTRATSLPAPSPERSAPAGMAAMKSMVAPAPAAAPAPPPETADMAAPAEQTQAVEGTEETVFVLANPVDLAAGHTASVPILDRDVPAERIGLVAFDKPHPLAAVRVTNDGTSSLPAGVLTLYDPTGAAAFAGDARLGGLPAGESRLLSFAEDLRTAVTWHSEEGVIIASLTAAKGIVTIAERHRWTGRIALAAPAGDARHLLIEIPKSLGETLVQDGTPGPVEETVSAWRLAVSLAAGETRTLTVHVDQVTSEQTALIDDDSVVMRLLGEQGLTDAAKASLRHLADLRAEEASHRAEHDGLRAEIGTVEHDEDRIRSNIAAVPANDTLHGKLVRQLEAAEDRLATLGHAADQAQEAADQAHKALADAVAGLKL